MSIFKRDYKININQDDWVSPEETLLDSGSKHSDIEQPISGSIFSVVFVCMSILTIVLLAMVVRLSIFDFEYLTDLSFQNSTANFFIPPPRGLIIDRNGIQLVKNYPKFDLLVISREIKDNQEEVSANFQRISEIMDISTEVLKTSIYDGVRQSSAFIIVKDLTKDQLLALNIFSPKGFYVVPNVKRSYIDGPQFSQMMGYIGKVNKEDLVDKYYKSTDLIGRLGLEAKYENYLRGEHGKIFFSHDEDNKNTQNQDPKSGKNLILNIDAELQKKLYLELYEVLLFSGLDKSAAIIQNPNTGEVLALASFPTFNNNLFVDGLTEKEFNRLFENKSRPMFNRVISGLYNPGSTIKPFYGLAILEENIFSSADTIHDCVSLIVPNLYNPDNPAIFNNWRADLGLFNLQRAIANSCNVYFFIAGGGYKNIKGLGIENIKKYLHLGMADIKLGIDLPGEENGFIPDSDWKLREKGENWYQGDTYNISIGQGDLLVSPLWINSYISAIANGGIIYKPYLVNKIVDQDKNIIKSFEPQKLTKLPFKKENIAEIKSDMEETVLSGTAQIFKDLPVRVAAKTGTAEIIKGVRVNSLFTAFAPYENPELAITVLIEGASTNQGLAIKVAYNVFKWYFSEVVN